MKTEFFGKELDLEMVTNELNSKNFDLKLKGRTNSFECYVRDKIQDKLDERYYSYVDGVAEYDDDDRDFWWTREDFDPRYGYEGPLNSWGQNVNVWDYYSKSEMQDLLRGWLKSCKENSSSADRVKI